MGHLAVQEAGAGDGAHLDLVANPSGEGLGDVALIQATGKRETVIPEDVSRTVLVLGIEVFNESGLPRRKGGEYGRGYRAGPLVCRAQRP